MYLLREGTDWFASSLAMCLCGPERQTPNRRTMTTSFKDEEIRRACRRIIRVS